MGNSNLNTKHSSLPDSVKTSYFQLHKQKQHSFFKSLLNNGVNEYIATEKKYFDKMTNIKINIPIPKKSFIYWKDDIIHFLLKQSEKVLWYEDLIEQIQAEPFLSENKYLSLAFFSEYGYHSIPQSIQKRKDIEQKMTQHEIIEEKLLNASVLGMNANKNNNYLQSRIIINATNLYGGSMGSFQEENSFNEFTQEFVQKRQRIKDLTKLFKSHLNNEDHPIKIIMEMFEKKISLIIKLKKDETLLKKQTNTDEYKEQLEELTELLKYHIQKFIIKTQRCLKLFYAEVCDLSCFIEEKDELINCVSSVLFNIGTLHNELYDLVSIQLEKEVLQFSLKLSQLENITTKELGVDPKFSLDDRTEAYLQKVKQNPKNKNLPEISEQEELEKNKNIIVNQNWEKQINVSDNFRLRNKIKGFETLNKILKGVSKTKAPFEKMVLIASLSTEITECVNEFWKGYEQYLTPEFLVIAADDLMTLYIYAIIKANFPELLIHNQLIKMFTTKTTKSTMVGYYYTTIEADTEYLQTNDIERKKNDNDNIGITDDNADQKENSDEIIISETK